MTFSANVLWPSGGEDVVIGIVAVVVFIFLVVLGEDVVVVFTGCDVVVVCVVVGVVVGEVLAVVEEVVVVDFLRAEVVVD